jgi:hypothetical protein
MSCRARRANRDLDAYDSGTAKADFNPSEVYSFLSRLIGPFAYRMHESVRLGLHSHGNARQVS